MVQYLPLPDAASGAIYAGVPNSAISSLSEIASAMPKSASLMEPAPLVRE